MIPVVVVYIQTIDGNTLDFVLRRMKWYSFAQENTCVEVSCDICKIFKTVILKNIFIQTCYFSNKFKHYLKIYQKTSIFVCSAFQFTAENTFSFQIFLKKSICVYHICFIRNIMSHIKECHRRFWELQFCCNHCTSSLW